MREPLIPTDAGKAAGRAGRWGTVIVGVAAFVTLVPFVDLLRGRLRSRHRKEQRELTPNPRPAALPREA
jgi:hypothetical protein